MVAGTDTKERLLDAAERLYARDGIEAASLRGITAAAGANLAAVHYHFGSKEALTEAVFSRRIGPINEERLALLDQAERRGGRVPVETILDAFVGPPLRLSHDREYAQFIRLMGRMYSEPSESLQSLLGRQFGPLVGRFSVALHQSLPDLPPADLHWRLHFMVGAMVHVVSDPARMQSLSGGLCDPSDVDGTTRQLIAFLAAGFRASTKEKA